MAVALDVDGTLAAWWSLGFEGAALLQSKPAGAQNGATAQALEAICEFDLTDLQAIEPPLGFGRD